jgi:hypothetical protein
MPVSRHGLVPLGGLGAPFADVVGEADAEVAGEQEDLLLVVAQPGGEGVAGVVPAAVPVPQAVVGEPELDGGVVAFAQVVRNLLAKGGAAAGAGPLDLGIRLAEDLDDVVRPLLQAAGGRASRPGGLS